MSTPAPGHFDLRYPFGIFGALVGAFHLWMRVDVLSVCFALALPAALLFVANRAWSHGGWILLGGGGVYIAQLAIGGVLNTNSNWPSVVSVALFGGATQTVILSIPLFAFLFAAREVQGARHGSLAAKADLAFVYAAGACTLDYIVLALAYMHYDGDAERALPLAFGGLLASKLLFAAAPLVVALRIRSIEHRAQRMTVLMSGVRTDGVPTIDLGIGDSIRGEIDEQAAGYRDAPVARSLVLGDGALAAAHLRATLKRYAKMTAILHALPIVILLIALFR